MANNYVAKDGAGVLQTFAALFVSGALYPVHVLAGLVGGSGAPQPLNVDVGGNVGVQPLPAGSNAIGGVTIADGANSTQGAVADAAWSGSGSGSIIAILKAIWTRLSGVFFGQVPVAEPAPVAMNGTWIKVWTAAPAKRIVIGLASDSAASGDYSFRSALAGTSASGGIPIGGGAGGSFDFAGGAIPNSDIYVKATNGSSVTVQVFN